MRNHRLNSRSLGRLGLIGRIGRLVEFAEYSKLCSKVLIRLRIQCNITKLKSELITAYNAKPDEHGQCKHRSRLSPSINIDRYLVDSASSHMLVSKIKPCMSKNRDLPKSANGSLQQP